MIMKNERGSIIMLVVVFSLISSILGFAVLYMNGLEYLAVRRDVLDARALLIAEGGLDVGRAFLYFCDARLEDAADMAAAGGGTTRDAVVNAMSAPQAPDKNYQVYGAPISIDSAFPHAYCEVWISSACDNMATEGVFKYRITSKGVATYGFPGARDSVKIEHMVVTISSMVFTSTDTVPSYASGWLPCSVEVSSCAYSGKKHLPGDDVGNYNTRYFFKYDRDGDGYPSREEPTQGVVH